MNPIIFHNVERLYLVWVVPVMIGLFIYAAHRRTVSLRRFADEAMLPRLTGSASCSWPVGKAAATCLAFILTVVALARPAWRLETTQRHRRGRDVVFVLDCSRSMLADDLVPNRLERAKLAIRDCVEQLEGDRVALVAFAGSAVVRCPLTLDYAFLRMVLEDVGPDTVPQGGTRIGDAIHTTIEDVLIDSKPGSQDIVLITDGEDHDSAPMAAARQLAQAGARLIAVGIGDDTLGKRILVTNEATGVRTFLTYHQQEVWSRLESRTLRRMVGQTPGGVYFHVATGAVNLAAIYRRLIASADAAEFDSQNVARYEEAFPLFLGLAFICLSLAGGGRGRKHWPNISRSATVASSCCLALLVSGHALGASSRTLLAKGKLAYETGDFAAAAAAYEQALSVDPESPIIVYNLGNALYRNGRYQEAAEAFENSVSLTDDAKLRADCLHNLGNCVFKQASDLTRVDRKTAVEFYQMSAQYYRAALDFAHDRRETGYNLEVARRAFQTLADQIQADEEKQAQLFAEIRDKLLELIQRQQAAATTGLEIANTQPNKDREALERDVTSLTTDQHALERETRQLAEKMKQADREFSQFLSSLPNAPAAPFDKSRRHLLSAAGAQERASDHLEAAKLTEVYPQQEEALDELKQALDALPSQPDQNPQEGQGGKTSSEEQQESDKESEPQEGDQTQEPPPDAEWDDTDQDVDEFTAPKETPEDILNEERRNKLLRAKRRPNHLKAVDKNW